MKRYQENSLNLPFQTYRRRSLPGLPSVRPAVMPVVVTDTSHEVTYPGQYKDRQVVGRRNSYTGRIAREIDRDRPFPSRPTRPSLHLEVDTGEDYHSEEYQQILTPVTPVQAPQLMLEFPSEESSRRPSRCSGVSGSCSPSSFQPTSQEHSGLLRPAPYGRRINRRASHACILRKSSPEKPQPLVPPSEPHLNVPGSRTRGKSLPDQLSSSELYRLRNFATSGRKVINKGDSFKSRNTSLKSSRSR